MLGEMSTAEQSDDLDLVLVDVDSALAVGTEAAVPKLVAAWLLGFASVNTRRAYSGDVNAWLAFCDGYRLDPLTSVRRSHVDAWARTLEAAGQRPRTVARRISLMSSFYGFLVDEEVRMFSPAEHVRRPVRLDGELVTDPYTLAPPGTRLALMTDGGR